ncbi:MAG: STAS domain-containing protein [Planctomycetota bacterium]|nr:STAS domain-containing protein [Planctomycetota bacterium]
MSNFDGMTFETLPEALVVSVQAEKLDYMVLDKLDRRITAQATMAGKFNVILDLGAVEFIPSMLMSVLVKTLKRLGDQGRKFLLVGMNRHIRASLKLTRIDVLFDLHDSVNAARTALGAGVCP